MAMRLSPVLPTTAKAMLNQLDPDQNVPRNFDLGDVRDERIGKGHVVGKPVPLFPRIEVGEGV